MRKIILPVICSFFLATCGEEKSEEKEKKEQPKVAVPETTEYQYDFDMTSIPKAYKFETMRVEDTIRRVTTSVEYVSETNEKSDFIFTEKIVGALLAAIEHELSFYDTAKNANETSSIHYGIVDFAETKDFISVRYVIDSYSHGAAHHNHDWFSLNYNKKEQRMYWIKDIFQFNNKKDSVEFIQLVGRNLDNHSVEMDVPFDSVDVFIKSEKEFLLGPELSWADGMRTAKLTIDDLRNFFRQRMD